ncbi:hypothetical protein [Caballeronia sp. TF1N1]|uniref:hypothetical protein n=1 Tax=Caballeronia sp. TF1N1 TaxID=2878153 RepID=UPI001FD4A485|nr:hypothetical protein [Caballeronia sp. TF1N1]
MPDDPLQLRLDAAPILADMVTENLILRLYQPGGVPQPDDPWFHDAPGDDGLTQAQKDLITKGLTDAAIAAAKATWDHSVQDIINDVLAQARSLLNSIVEATITKQMVTLQTDQESLAIEVDTWGARIGANAAAIQEEKLTYANDKLALAETIDQVVAGNAQAITAINDTKLAYVEGDTAIGKRIDAMVSEVGQNQASIVDLSETMADNEQATVNRETALEARLGASADAKIDTISKANATNYAAMVAQVQSFTVTLNGNSASIANEITARVAGDSANATATQQLSVRVGNTEAGINTINTALYTPGGAIASQITNLSVQVGNANYNASQAISISSQYGGRWAVNLDNNGYIVGLILNNGAAGSGFWVSADSFVVAKPGYAARQGFVVQYVDGVPQLSIQQALIGDANVNTLKLAGNAVTIPQYREGSSSQVSWNGNGPYQAWVEQIYYPQATSIVALISWASIAIDSSTNSEVLLYVDGGLVLDTAVSVLKDYSQSATASKQFWISAGWHTFDLRFGDNWREGRNQLQRWAITLLGCMR